MKKLFYTLLFSAVFFSTKAQVYSNQSEKLPDNGARDQSMDVQAADLDGDGDLDIVLANEFQTNRLLINDGKGNFTSAPLGQIPQAIHDSEDVAIADFNGDKFLDLAFCSEDDVKIGTTNVHELYFNDGHGTFTEATYRLPDSEANALIAADLNNDDRPDLLMGNAGQNFILINQGDGTFRDETAQRLPALSRVTQDIHLVDIDGDKDLDWVDGNENGNSLLVNDGQGFFTDVSNTQLPKLNQETRKVSSADVDGDGDMDLFFCNVAFLPAKNPQNRLLLNDGNGLFTDASLDLLPQDNDLTIDAVFEDVNGDEHPDILIANVFGGSLRVYVNDGTGWFNDQTESIFGAEYTLDALGIITADLDNDGLRDVYVCDRNTGTPNKDLLLLRQFNTSTKQVSLSQQIQVFPNPIEDVFWVQLPGKEIKACELRSSDGKSLAKLRITARYGDRYQLQLSDKAIPPGIYLLELNVDGQLISKKVLKG
ncbi:MAG: T9SS type A sorting domain-containing protein [Bacteroidota bacterium]